MSDSPHASLDRAIEALLFAAEAPLGAEEMARAYAEVTGADLAVAEVESAVQRLNTDYQAGGRVFRIRYWAGGYRLASIEEVGPFIKALYAHESERRLTRALLETLAIIAYKQPVTKPEVDHVRGVNADYALQQLLERGFITIVGRSESVGRPLLYGTTEQFLDQFGLGTLEELPRPREIEELLADPAFSRERAVLTAEMAALAAETNGAEAHAPEPSAGDSSAKAESDPVLGASEPSPDPLPLPADG